MEEIIQSDKILYLEKMPYAEDEIDLADLFKVLFRRKWLIIGLTVLTTLLAMGAAATLPKKFNVSALMEIGTLAIENNEVKMIASPHKTIAALKKYGRIVEAKMQNAPEAEKQGLDFSTTDDVHIKSTKDGRQLSIDIKTSKGSEAVSFINQVVDAVKNEHRQLISHKKKLIDQQIRQKKTSILEIDHKIMGLKNNIKDLERAEETKKVDISNAIAGLENKILNLQSGKKSFDRQISDLKKEKMDLAKLIKETENRYFKLLDSKFDFNSQAKDAGAVEILFYRGEIQRIQTDLAKLRQRFMLTIPSQISQIQTDLMALSTQKLDIEADINLKRLQLKQLKPETDDKIESIKREIDSLMNNRQNLIIEQKELEEGKLQMTDTDFVLKPEISQKPVSPKPRLIISLGFTAGLFFAIISAFLLEFWRNNREKILSTD